jgi:hypothetical protein
MSTKIYMEALCAQYDDLLQQMLELFPKDPDWPAYRIGLAVLRRASPKLLATSTWDYVAPYEAQIRSRDESFFLTTTLATGTIVETIDKLRSMWSQLTPHNRSIVWDYITNITQLAKTCSDLLQHSPPG